LAKYLSCLVCNQSDYVNRKGQVRDNPNLEILECLGCGLVTLNSFEHIHQGFYENSGMHGEDRPSI